MARLTTLLFAMWLGVTVSTEVDLEKRVFGGEECGPNERWYHVRLNITDINGNHYTCGGSLISPQWILTAAHCVEPGENVTVYVGVHPGPPKEVDITKTPKIFKDPFKFFSFNERKKHDLMLLKLPEAVVGIKPVQLPDCEYHPNIGDTVQVAGHGLWNIDINNVKAGGSSPTLQCGDMNIADCQAFKSKFPGDSQAREHEHWLCYEDTLVDACNGDSGGGVVYQCQIYGVHVRSDPEVCTSPAVSMDLCYKPYLKWIKDTIK